MDFSSGGSALDFATFMNGAMQRNDGMLGGNNGLLWIFLLLLFNGNGGLFGGSNAAGDAVDKAVAQARADGLSDQVVLDAVHGNANAIQQLATTLNCDLGAIKSSLCDLDKGIALLSGEVGTTGERIINAIQQGNCTIVSKLAECCCNLREGQANIAKAISDNGYQNRIQLMEQSQQLGGMMTAGFNQIGNKIDYQTAAMNAGFQGIKDYLCAEKIEGLEHQVTQLRGEANNAAQTATIGNYVHNALEPIKEQVNQLTNAIPPRAVPAYPAPILGSICGGGGGYNTCGYYNNGYNGGFVY